MPELAKAYEPRQVEDRLYAKWQESGVYRANPKSSNFLVPKLHLGTRLSAQFHCLPNPVNLVNPVQKFSLPFPLKKFR